MYLERIVIACCIDFLVKFYFKDSIVFLQGNTIPLLQLIAELVEQVGEVSSDLLLQNLDLILEIWCQLPLFNLLCLLLLITSKRQDIVDVPHREILIHPRRKQRFQHMCQQIRLILLHDRI